MKGLVEEEVKNGIPVERIMIGNVFLEYMTVGRPRWIIEQLRCLSLKISQI